MSSTLDVNVLLYASDSSSPLAERAKGVLESFVESGEILYVFWPTSMAYLRIATHPAIFDKPLSAAAATANLDSMFQLPNVRTPGEGDSFWHLYQTVTQDHVVRGNLVPDAQLVALMRQYEVDTILTRDSDFRRFRGVRVHDPFADGADRS